jgi:hypothetical protein
MPFDIEADTLAGACPEERLYHADGSPTRVGWARIRSEAADYVRENAAILATFRERITSLFEAMRGDKEPFKRRPNISLRLIAAGTPTAKVITLPGVRFDRAGGYLLPASHVIELMEQREVKVRGADGEQDALQFRRKLSIYSDGGLRHLEPCGLTGSLYASAVEDARRIVGTIREFLDDSRAVLARGCDHCAICGRGLTDELSRSRGIGPECIKRSDIVLALISPVSSGFALPEAVEA